MRDPRFRHPITDAQRAEMALLADWPDGDPNASVKTAEDAIARIPSQQTISVWLRPPGARAWP